MSTCSKCGASLIGSGKFCAACGAPVVAAPLQPPLPPVGVPAARKPGGPQGTELMASPPAMSARAPTPPPPPPPPPAPEPTAAPVDPFGATVGRSGSYGPPPPPQGAPQYAPPPAPPPPPPAFGGVSPLAASAFGPMPQVNPAWGAPQQPSAYGAPQAQPAYGAPPQPQPQPQPQPSAYGAPQPQQPYGQPQPAYGAPQPQPAYGAPQPQPAYGAVPQQPYGAGPSPFAPHAQPPAAFGPGARVLVQWADGNRYPGTVQQAASGQCLVMFPDGRTQWVDAQYLSAGV